MAQYSGSASWIGGVAAIALLAAGCASKAPAPVTTASPPPPVPTPAAAPAAAPTPTPRPVAPVAVREDAPLRYVVQPGDTLWGLSKRFLVEPWQWPEIWYVNEQVANPHLIYPGDVLTLIMRDGRPVLQRDTAPAHERVLRLGPQVRELALDQAIPAIPLEAIRDFLNSPRLVDADELKRAPYIIAFGEDQLIAGANSPAYVRNVPADSDYRWAVVRPDESIVDPETKDVLGFAATPVGGLEIREYSEPAAYGWLTVSEMEARVGDRLIAIEDLNFDARFHPRAPTEAVDGRIVWIAQQRLQATQYQVVAFNRGLDHGLVPGHLLTIRESGRVVTDPYTKGDVVLPDREIGNLMVFKVGPRLGFGLVLDATRPVQRLDRVVHPDGS